MSGNIKKSALLRTSAATDVKISGGVVSITGLRPFSLKDTLSAKKIYSKSEVVQVAKVGYSLYTPTADTKYTVQLINSAFGQHGNQLDTAKKYAYTTPTDITTLGATAALQREAIHAQLITAINNDSRNLVVAATLGTGTGFTITDDAGYFPARSNGASNGRQGATIVRTVSNPDGSGWVSSNGSTVTTEVLITTSAVYGFGIGSRMDDDTPVVHSVTGNLVSGEIDAPKTISGDYAVSGQLYNAFAFQTLTLHDIPTVGNGVQGYKISEQFIFVDNGAGSDTTNASGYSAFQREILRVVGYCYKNDPSAIVEFFDNGIGASSVAVAATGLPTVNGVASGAAGDVNALFTGKNVFHYAIIGTATAIVPIWTSSGLNLDQDAADNDGLELGAAIGGPVQFKVGTNEVSLYVRASIADVSDVEFLHFGFRKSEAYQTADGGYATYTDLAAVGFDTETATQAIKIITNLNDAASPTSTDTGLTWADAATKEIEVIVKGDRSVVFKVNGSDQSADQASAFSFDSGDTIIPYIYHQLGTASAPSVVIKELLVLPTANWSF